MSTDHALEEYSVPVRVGDVHSGIVDKGEAERLCRLAEGLRDQPPWAAEYLRQASPYIQLIGSGVDTVGPVFYHVGIGLYRCYNRMPRKAVSCMWGLGVCFYGSGYPLSLAALEAFKMTGGNAVHLHLRTLFEVAERVNKEACEEESRHERSPENDESASEGSQVPQCSFSKAKNRLKLFFRFVDPGQVSEAIRGICSGYMGVVAALKTKYARITALTNSVSESVRPAATKMLGPTFLALVPPDYQQWINPLLNYLSQFVAMMLAWRIQCALSTIQSSITGGLLAARSAVALVHAGRSGDDQDSMVDDVIGWSLAACGIYYQLVQRGKPPIIFAPVCWPLGFAEIGLRWSVSYLGNQ